VLRRKAQKWAVIAIIAVVCISLIGTSIIAIFPPGVSPSAEEQNQQALKNEYEHRKQIVESLSKQLESDPGNPSLQFELGDAYYYKSGVSGELNKEEFYTDLQKAIQMYQAGLEQKEDNQVMLKLANAALLLGDAELAGTTYESLLKKEPSNAEALYWYGMYFFYLKEDHKQALANWQKALNLTKDENLIKILNEMITVAQNMDLDKGQDSN